MINVQVARCQSVLANETRDIRAILITQAGLIFLAIMFIVFGPPVVAILPLIIAFAMVIPFGDYYQKYSRRLSALLEATRNIPVDVDLDF